jgi:hypothetical protein
MTDHEIPGGPPSPGPRFPLPAESGNGGSLRLFPLTPASPNRETRFFGERLSTEIHCQWHPKRHTTQITRRCRAGSAPSGKISSGRSKGGPGPVPFVPPLWLYASICRARATVLQRP